jgi:hypothetical protein
LHEGIREAHALSSQAIAYRRRDLRMSGTAKGGVALIVHQDENYIGARRGAGGNLGGSDRQAGENEWSD